MKNCIILLIILFSATVSFAQKHDSKIVDHKLVNEKLANIEAIIKKLETTLNEAKALMNDLKKQKDELPEMNEQDMFQLQQLMQQTSPLEKIISNTIKAGAEAKSALAASLKAT